MVGPIKSNLEPIEESDLDLEGKLTRGDFETHQGNVEQSVFKIEKEYPKEVHNAEKDAAYGNILSKIQTEQEGDDTHDITGDAQNTSEKMDAESQVQHLVDVALEKGVVHAVKVARHLEDNYVLDTFHDKMLADELHDALMKKGLITEL